MVQKHFPQVDKVVDADEGVAVKVTKRDSQTGRKKSPEQCALAKACVRELEADGAIINMTFSYIVTGKVATRYQTSIAVGREITSFDRNSDFEPGTYLLSKVRPSARLGYDRHSGTSGRHAPWKMPVAVHKHQTDNIRVTERH
jgi:hypothetical protein